jgi:DNA mismatch repair protein MutS
MALRSGKNYGGRRGYFVLTMLNVADLRLEQDVLPFFNFTDNPYARQSLLTLLQTPPLTQPEVVDRQLTLQGFIRNWARVEHFAYRRLDYLEVHAYFQQLHIQPRLTGIPALKRRLQLRFSEAHRSQLRAPYTQLVLLLEKLERRFLLPLDRSAFPAAFQSQLTSALRFLAQLNLAEHLGYIQEDTFTSNRLQAFSARLCALPSGERADFWAFLALFEAYWSIVRGMLKHGFAFPSLGASGFLLQEFYHPVVANPVKNTLHLLAGDSVVVLTGPNMSGKSTLLKAVALCVYLAHVGVGVPAGQCQIPFFSSIAIAINLQDDLQSGYSHFMTEIQNLKAVVQHAQTGHCFAVFDELFRGTNVDDALDITQTTLRGLTQFSGSLFFISTHLMDLQGQLADVGSVKNYYVECRLEQEVPRFSYLLREGWSTLKIGRILFDKAGLGELLNGLKTAPAPTYTNS